MKKVLSLILAVLMAALALTSCGKASINYMNTDISKYLTVGDYKGITVELPKLDPVDDAAVDAAISAELDGKSELKVVERAAQLGDVVDIDYVGTIGGETLENGTGSSSDLGLGSGMMIPGFEDGIVGMVAGEKKTVDATFPEDYENNPELSGKTAQFEITLNSVSEKVTPTLTDDLAAELAKDKKAEDGSEIKTVEQYRAYIKADLEATYNNTVEQNKSLYAWSAVVNGSTVKAYPENVVKKMGADLYAYYDAMYYQYKQYGLTLDNLGITKEGCMTEAREMVKEELCLYAIVKAEGFTVTDEEYEARVAAIVEEANANSTSTLTVDEYKAMYSRQNTETKIFFERVMKLVMENAKFVNAD